MSESTIADLALTFTTPLPADLLVSAHSPGGGGAGKVLATDLPGSGGGGGSGPPLATSPPLDPAATAATGTSGDAARADHVHKVQNAAATPFTPTGSIAASTVQAALAELDTEKLAANLLGAANGAAQLDSGALIQVAELPQIPATKTNVAAVGSLPAANLQTTLGTMDARISTLSQSLTLGGTYNAATDAVAPIAGQGFSAGPLPAASGFTNKYLIINTTGTGIGNAAGLGTLDAGNWIYSTGSAWVELVVNTGSVAASQVTSTASGDVSATNVDAAIAELAAEKVPATRSVLTSNSLTGGGALSADRTLQLVGDAASPGANKVYGTDSGGSKGWKNDPSTPAALKRPWRVLSTTLPAVTPAARSYFAGVSGNGVSYPIYDFEGNADNFADFFGIVDPGYADGAFTLKFNMFPQQAGNIITFGAAFCRLGSAFVVDAAFTFSYQSVNVTPGTLRAFAEVSIPFTKTQADNVFAGVPFLCRLRRLGTDTNTGVASMAVWSLMITEN